MISVRVIERNVGVIWNYRTVCVPRMGEIVSIGNLNYAVESVLWKLEAGDEATLLVNKTR